MRIIGHLDMDAFFAAVEERDHEWLRGKPVIVGADPKDGAGRGVVSTANYKAREYGVHSALPISIAWRLCKESREKGKPECFFLAGNFRKYEEVSGKIMEILRRHSDLVEEASVDEAYFDLSGNTEVGLQGSPKSDFGIWEEAIRTAKKIKKEVWDKEKLTCSIGIGPNKLIAKIASDFKKPDGFTVVEEKDAEKFLEPMAIRKIPGIGPKTEAIFSRKGMKTVFDLKKLSAGELPHFYDKIRGRDNSPLIEEREAKSISEENTFEKDTRDPILLLQILKDLSARVYSRFDASEHKTFKTASLKIRFENFETKTRAHTLTKLASSKKILEGEAMKLFLPFLDSRENPRKWKIRLLGVKIEKLS
ncbi:hypothetical protein A2Z63_02780 [Candidatus Giovannonibacteria bacterium RIFCSPLOWO2_02_44_8]|uniref:DNA polymerase IV n=1 Tax=Candidatus Giovannonibacteria bacterium RIFCSPLOWO2_02_44_8 TaxID=1798355 RepID=A0A1F5XE37_9BACT|nr:MAG: hypothetical protein A2Z63_02780 [Candidatus Giovannonibacteria bacterium RIFCSPLOWO2_02_44_8]